MGSDPVDAKAVHVQELLTKLVTLALGGRDMLFPPISFSLSLLLITATLTSQSYVSMSSYIMRERLGYSSSLFSSDAKVEKMSCLVG